MYAEAILTLEHKNSALVVPLQAVNQTGSQATIFLVDADNMLQERKITLGLADRQRCRGAQRAQRGRSRGGERPERSEGRVAVQPQQVEVLQYQSEKPQ